MTMISPTADRAVTRHQDVPVAVILMTAEMREHLIRSPTRLVTPTFTITDTAGATWRRNRRYLAVFKTDIDGGEVKVVGLSVMVPAKMASDFTRRVQLEQFTLLDNPIPVDVVREQLGSRYADAIDVGPPTPARAKRLLATLEALEPSVSAYLYQFSEGVPVAALDEKTKEVRSFEKDATATLLDAVLGERTAVRNTGLLSASQPFVDVMHGSNSDVNHDWLRFSDWEGIDDVSYGVRRFRNHDDGELVVCNLTKRRPEEIDGVDLLYYNDLHGCFVLVQYKRLLKNKLGFYYPGDPDLNRQLERLRAVDERCPPGKDIADIRLHPQPSFFKFCEPSEFEYDSIDLLKGVYLARPHFEIVYEGATTLPGASQYRIGAGQLPRHLNSSGFTMLLAHGWIGSCGVGSDFVRGQARLSLSMRGSLVFGLHTTPHPLGNSFRRSR